MHLYRWRTHGDPLIVTHYRGRGPAAGGWVGDDISYRGAHARVVNTRGRPQGCEFCGTTVIRGKRPFQWALSHGATKVKVDDRGRVYSPDPFEYVRLCSACHGRYDQAGVPRTFRQAARFGL